MLVITERHLFARTIFCVVTAIRGVYGCVQVSTHAYFFEFSAALLCLLSFWRIKDVYIIN